VRNQRKGLSLFELVVVLAILVIAIAVAVPLMSGMFGDTPTRAAADMVKSRWAEARAKAMEEGKPYRFQVTDNTHFRIAPDDDFDNDDSATKDELPRAVTFGNNQGGNGQAGSTDGNYTVVFLPDGTATTNVELPLSGQNGPPVTLKLNKSGVVDVAR
jgi:general secretion pathway protein H